MKNIYVILFFIVSNVSRSDAGFLSWLHQVKSSFAGNQGDWVTAKKNILRALIDEPDRADLLYDIGVISYELEEYQDAFKYFAQAAQLARDQGQIQLQECALYNQANTAIKLNEAVEALALYESVLTINPDNMHARHNKAALEAVLQELIDTYGDESSEKHDPGKYLFEKNDDQRESAQSAGMSADDGFDNNRGNGAGSQMPRSGNGDKNVGENNSDGMNDSSTRDIPQEGDHQGDSQKHRNSQRDRRNDHGDLNNQTDNDANNHEKNNGSDGNKQHKHDNNTPGSDIQDKIQDGKEQDLNDYLTSYLDQQDKMDQQVQKRFFDQKIKQGSQNDTPTDPRW